MAKKVAIGGGVSDPRNGTVLKIFSLINYGERAGSGLNSIFHVWEHVYHNPAEISEEVGVDRVTVKLPNGGHEQDVKAMLELYDNPEELTFPDEEVSDKVSEYEENVRQNSNLSDKLAIKWIIGDKLAIMQRDSQKFGDKVVISPKTEKKLAIKEEIVDKLADIVVFLRSTTVSNSTVISQLIGKGKSTTKNYLSLLIKLGLVEAHGGNKNRTYSANADIT